MPKAGWKDREREEFQAELTHRMEAREGEFVGVGDSRWVVSDGDHKLGLYPLLYQLEASSKNGKRGMRLAYPRDYACLWTQNVDGAEVFRGETEAFAIEDEARRRMAEMLPVSEFDPEFIEDFKTGDLWKGPWEPDSLHLSMGGVPLPDDHILSRMFLDPFRAALEEAG